jgi:DNA polymerase III epsilon subunit-like protein
LDFVVIDTEGNPELSEIAILDSQGQLIYEAFSAEHPTNCNLQRGLKPLKTIVQDITDLTQSKQVVCHYANHDLNVLKFSFGKAKVPWTGFSVACTWELAKQYLPNLESYSLEHLSKCLHLKVSDQRFNSAQAHTARYDAEFTYQLYLKILEAQHSRVMQTQLQHTANPFSSSRVDTPFQDHIDFQAVYQAEFELLKSVLGDIKADPNQQSKGAVVIGSAGSGKTHLIMRMAKELLRTNRLLFIRQPNNATAVLHHTYSRILESFAEKVVGSDRTQLELLLANSFVKILSSLEKVTSTQKGQEILAAFQNNSLSLYSRLGNEETQRHRESWQYIERHISEWWSRHYTAAGYSATILKGIIKFCSYSNPHKKDLVRRWLAASELEAEEAESIGLDNWQDDMSREEFALEAITVFGRLSTLDEPLIIVFDQLESLGLAHNAPILESFGAAVKEILTHVPNSLIILNLFPERWEQFKVFFDGSVVDRVSEYIVKLERPSPDRLADLLSLKTKSVGIELNTLFTPTELSSILSQDSIRAVLNRAAAYFRYKINNIPLPVDYESPVQKLSVESRLKQLEQVMSQIVSLVQPYLSSVSAGEGAPVTDVTEYIDATSPGPSKPINSNGGTARDDSIVPPGGQPSTEEVVSEYLRHKQQELTKDYTKPTIINDANEIGKLAAIAEAFKLCQDLEFYPLRLGKSKLPEHFCIKTAQQEFVIGFLNAGGSAFTARIKNFNQLVVSHPKTKFSLLRDSRESTIKGAVGLTEIEKLNHSPNGQFLTMEKEDRVSFELIYNLVIDIQEKDLEVDLAMAIHVLTHQMSNYWLIAALSSQ